MARKTYTGRCPTCHQRTIRGPDQHGQPACVETLELTPAQELQHHSDGWPTYTATWAGTHIELDLRDEHDITYDPPGHRPIRVYREHRCEGSTT